MIYIDKYNGRISSTQEPTWVDDIYYHDNDGSKKIIVKVFKENRLLWELIIGYVQTRDSFILETKDNFILKCKNQ